MRQRVTDIVLGLGLAGAAPAWATDYTAPLSPQQEDFKARFAERDAACRERVIGQFRDQPDIIPGGSHEGRRVSR